MRQGRPQGALTLNGVKQGLADLTRSVSPKALKQRLAEPGSVSPKGSKEGLADLTRECIFEGA